MPALTPDTRERANEENDSADEKLMAEGFSNDEGFAYPGRELEAMARSVQLSSLDSRISSNHILVETR